MISSGFRTLSIDDILDFVAEEDILEYYIGVTIIPDVILSPLRPDKNPSFSIGYGISGNIKYYDFGTGESGGVFDLLVKMFKLSFTEVLEMIYDEMIDGRQLSKKDRVLVIREKSERATIDDLKVKIRSWRQYDYDFWSSFGISKDWLEFGSVYPVSHMFILKDGNNMIIPCDKYAYAYVEFKDKNPTFKIYQPFSERYKWINKHDKSVWDLWSKLPSEGDSLIITSSRKDSLCLWANLNIPSICLQAESTGPKEHVVRQLIERFKNIYVLYDNDFKSTINWGRVNGEKLAREFNFKQIEIPQIYQSKDPSDFYRAYGSEMFKQVITKLLNE